MTDQPVTLEDLAGEMPVKPSSEKRIEAVGLVGGGVMGRGIAQTLASNSIAVIIVERDEDRVKACLDGLAENMNREIQRWAMTASEKKSILSRIKVTADLQDVASTDIVMESVDENYELKQDVMTRIALLVSPSTIIASSTSTLSLTKIAKELPHPERIIGLHFGNPVPKSPLCEIVRGFQTSDETFQQTQEFIQSLGKTTVEVYEYPGFITTRVIIPMLNEAMHVLMEGVASAEDIDTAMRLGYNFSMGPLELADTMGLEELLAWMESLWHELGDAKYRPCPLLRRLVREQKYGKKSGEGFFTYDGNGKRIVGQG